MQKITFILISVLFFEVSQAQKVQINVHTYGGNQRLYFPHPHSWYTNQGYQYSRHGYYIHNGKKVHPNRKEYYKPNGNNGRRKHGYGNPRMHKNKNGYYPRGNKNQRGKGKR